MKVVIGYDSEGHKIYRDEGPSRGRLEWSGSIHGGLVVPVSVHRDGTTSSLDAMRKHAKRLRGTGLEPG